MPASAWVRRPRVADAEEGSLRWGPGTRQASLYGAARTYAQATGLVASDRNQDPRQVLMLGTAYQERTLELMRDALQSLNTARERQQFWMDYVQSDPALNPVRRTQAFARLARQVRPRVARGARACQDDPGAAGELGNDVLAGAPAIPDPKPGSFCPCQLRSRLSSGSVAPGPGPAWPRPCPEATTAQAQPAVAVRVA